MLRAIYLFELRYHLTRGLPYLVGAFLGLIAFGAVSSDTVQIGGAIGNVNRNAPIVIVRLLAFLTPIATFVVTAFVASAAVRDYEQGTYPLFFSKPMKKWDYLMGRFGGSLTVSFLTFVLPCLGIAIGTLMPWIDPGLLGPFRADAYAFGMLAMVLPTTVFVAAVFFTLANWSRSFLFTYLGLIGFFVGFFIAQQMLGDVESLTAGALLDPFGIAALGEQVRYWTIVEQNGSVPELSGLLLWNRLLWTALGLGVFLVGALRFQPTQTGTRRRWLRWPWRKDDEEASVEVEPARPPLSREVPRREPSFAGGAWRQYLVATRFEMATVFKSIPFLIILAFGLLNIVGSSGYYDRMYGTKVYPVTHLMLTVIQGSYSFLLLIIAIFYAGELMWRDRSQDTSDVVDATPTPDGVFLLSKATALSAVILTFMGTGALATMGIQLWKGYTKLEPMLYLKGLALESWPFVLLGILALAVQVLTNHKFVGYMVMILYIISTIVLGLLDFDHNLYDYAGAMQTPYSDMNGYGHLLLGKLSFYAYWTFAAVVLIALSGLLWVRGHETARRFRLRLARQRFHGALRVVLAVGLIGFVLTGAWIFYNTNVLNEYVPGDVQRERLAAYETKYRKYLDVPMPRITDVVADVDIFPYERRIDARVRWQLANESGEPIETLYWTLPDGAEITEWSLPPHEVELDDEELNFRILRLDEPLAPDETFEISFAVEVEPKGFPNSGWDTNLVHNGTFFNNFTYFPALGYNPGVELRDRTRRRELGLGPVVRMAKLEDDEAREHTYLTRDSDWVTFETTVSTAPDQIVLAPGYLQKEWEEDGRRYFHYAMDAPILHFYAYLSARYEVYRDSWRDVPIEIYHQPGHTYNVERMADAIGKSLDYFTENFSPYQHRQVRILEFPRYSSFAQAFPNTIPFSESIGFIAKLEDEPDAIDYVFYVTAHEIAHQWWAHQVIGGNVQGATMLSETMAQYSALMVMEKEYGRDKMRRFLKFELDRYLQSRGGELVEELPLMRVENQQYIHYRKGSVVMYALRDLIGEDRLNRAVHAYVDAVAFQEPPFTYTPELLDFVKAETPPEHLDTIEDLFARITLYENKVDEAVYTALDDGRYRVRLVADARKLYADGQGVETEAELDEWIDVGVFAEKEVDGKTERVELFLEKRRVTEEHPVFEIVVDEEPARAGIDPYNKLVDRNSDDNLVKVEEASD